MKQYSEFNRAEKKIYTVAAVQRTIGLEDAIDIVGLDGDALVYTLKETSNDVKISAKAVQDEFCSFRWRLPSYWEYELTDDKVNNTYWLRNRKSDAAYIISKSDKTCTCQSYQQSKTAEQDIQQIIPHFRARCKHLEWLNEMIQFEKVRLEATRKAKQNFIIYCLEEDRLSETTEVLTWVSRSGIADRKAFVEYKRVPHRDWWRTAWTIADKGWGMIELSQAQKSRAFE